MRYSSTGDRSYIKAIGAAVVCIFAMLVIISPEIKAQDTSPNRIIAVDPVKFDEFGNIPWEDEKARLDNLAVTLQREPGRIAYIYVYAGRGDCIGKAQARARRAKNYLVRKRDIQPDRIISRDAGYREDVTSEIWVGPRSMPAPNATPTPGIQPSDAQIKNCKPKNRTRRVHNAARVLERSV